jgi:S-adenosylmethionine:diacylglycerol 3-amino-3-carboxypropyl transferase/SAM-dependent methyltransferase
MGIFSRLQDYFQDKTMDAILRRKIIYNAAWEDPRIDGKVLALGEGETILMLTTGGCNVLDRLLDGVAHIVSVDLNPCQNALLELKLAAAKALTHEQFFQLFAHSNRRLFDAIYKPQLRPLLSESAAAFWDANAGFFDDAMYAGASGGLARILCWLVWLFGLQPVVRAFHTCRTVEEQCALLDANEKTFSRMVRCFDMLLPVFCPFAGVPASQLRLVTGADGDAPAENTSVVRVFLDRVFRKTHIAKDNYFYFGYLYGKYSRTCCPRYLRPEYFEQLKAAAGRVTVKTKLLHEAALEYPDGYFSSMILLDHMDWLSPEQIQEEWAVFCRKLNPVTGRVLWRSFAYEQRWPMLKFLSYNPEVVAEAEEAMPDRVGMYNSCHLANVPPGYAICAPTPADQRAPSAAALRADRMALVKGLLQAVTLVPLLGAYLAACLAWAAACVAKLSEFVLGASSSSSSAAAPAAATGVEEGTDALLQMLPGIANGTWVDLGGTLAGKLRKGGENAQLFASVHAVHLAPGPRAVEAAVKAAARAAPVAKGCVDVKDHVVLSQNADVAKEIGVARGSADVVTLCHGLVAEADWPARLALAASLLKPGGLLAVTDLAPPNKTAAAAPTGVLGAAVGAVRGAVWEGARPRSVAPHKAAVMAKLAELTSPVHTEEKAARWPSLGAPLEAAHFVYVGRTPA